MLLELLSFQDDGTLSGLLAAWSRLARATVAIGRPAAAIDSGSLLAPDALARSAAASARRSGYPITDERAAAVLAGDSNAAEASTSAAVRGIADAVRAVLERPGELPLSESQLKYLQSLLLRHDPASASVRRQYRREGEDADAIPAALARLVAWTRAALEPVVAPDVPPPPDALLVVGCFAGVIWIRKPFASANRRLARVVAVQLLAQYGYSHLVADLETDLEALGERLDAAAADRDVATWVAVFVEALALRAERLAAAAGPVGTGVTDDGAPERGLHGPVPAGVLLQPRQERVLSAMRAHGAAKIGDLLAELGIPRATLKKDLRALVDAGLVATTGVRKGTVYRVLPAAGSAD